MMSATAMRMTIVIRMVMMMTTTTIISGIPGGQLGLFHDACLLTITELDDDDDVDDDDDDDYEGDDCYDNGDDDVDEDDDDFRHSGWPGGPTSGLQ